MMQLGLYKLVRRLGEGGYGEVWEALHPSGRRVAIKKLRDRGKMFVDALRDEARKLYHLRGVPGIVSLVDHELNSPDPFIVLELADGSLQKWINGPMQARRVIHLALQVVAVVGEAHARGVVHRDIKPENILLRKGKVQLADFGLARGQGSLLLTVGGAGTPGYMAPEQIHGRPTEGSDVFGIGATLFHLMTGRRPPRESASLDPRGVVPNCPPGLAMLVLRMTAFDQEQRPSLDQIARELQILQTALNPPNGPGAGFWAGLATVVGLVGLGVVAANSNSFDESVGRYRDREGKFRGGRFG